MYVPQVFLAAVELEISEIIILRTVRAQSGRPRVLEGRRMPLDFVYI